MAHQTSVKGRRGVRQSEQKRWFDVQSALVLVCRGLLECREDSHLCFETGGTCSTEACLRIAHPSRQSILLFHADVDGVGDDAAAGQRRARLFRGLRLSNPCVSVGGGG